MDGTALGERPERTASMLLDSVPPSPFDPESSIDDPPEDAEATVQQRRPPLRAPSAPAVARPSPAPVSPPAHTSAPLGRTSDLPRDDFSMILSAADEAPRPPTERPESRLGEVLGSYQLVEVIGRGGMGSVYRAKHVKLGRDVALKLLREDYAQRRGAVARFFQEARAVNLIRHRNIVDIIDYVEVDQGSVFIIMELLSGPSLGKLMRQPGGLPTQRALGILAQICEGLSAAHAVGVVHRDLKPDNIIVVKTDDGNDLVKILDFGVAKLIDKTDADPELTQVGAVIGTPAYMSPEQAGGLAVDPRSDVYSLGAIMYELFTGQLPFRASSFGEYVRMHLGVVPPPPRSTPGGADLDPRIDAMIQRCLAKSPSARYESAEALRAEIASVLGTMETLPTGGPPGAVAVAGRMPPAAAQVPSAAAAAVTTPLPPAGPPTPYPGGMHATPAPYGQATPEPLVPAELARGSQRTRRETMILGSAAIVGVAALAFAILRLAGGGASDGEKKAEAAPAVAAGAERAQKGEEPRAAAGAGTAAGTATEAGTAPAAGAGAATGTAPATGAGTGTATEAGNAAAAGGEGEAATPVTLPPVKVRVASSPSGRVFEEGGDEPLCTTPCSIEVPPPSPDEKRRTYFVRRTGYLDEAIAIDLSDPPRQVRVTLEREPRPRREPDRERDHEAKPKPKPKPKHKPKEEPFDSDATFNPFKDP